MLLLNLKWPQFPVCLRKKILINLGLKQSDQVIITSKSLRAFFVALKSRVAPTPKSLAAGTRQPRPAHIPAHLPPLPDPHSYIKTPVGCLIILAQNGCLHTRGGLFLSDRLSVL